jgi:hypothetical protein
MAALDSSTSPGAAALFIESNKDDAQLYRFTAGGQNYVASYVAAYVGGDATKKLKVAKNDAAIEQASKVREVPTSREDVPGSRDDTSGGREGGGGGTGAGAGGGGGGGGVTEKPDAKTEDSAIEQDKLNNQAQALTNSYKAAAELAKKPLNPDIPRDLVASINSVITAELSGISVTGNAWTPNHSRLLRQTAGLLLNNVNNPELQQFVQSYDAEMSKGDSFSESAGSLGITRRGAEALKSFVIANMNTQPQKGIAQLILRDASGSPDATLLPGGPSFLASAWSLIFGLRAEFRRIEELRKIAGSPVMRYPWPPRDNRNFSDSPAEDSSVGPNLTLRVWTQADPDDKLDLGGNTVVLTFEADSSSFAKKIEDLPSILRLRTATRSREEAVRSKK